jgi:hypothetical protein
MPAMKDEDGYLFIMSRIDDIINVAGHRLSTGGMEEVLASHPDVAECAVIGVADKLKGELPLGMVVLKAGVDRDVLPRSEGTDRAGARQDRAGGGLQAGDVVERLPKTRSGKILRGTMKRIADGREYRMPATIDDPAILTGDPGLRDRLRIEQSRFEDFEPDGPYDILYSGFSLPFVAPEAFRTLWKQLRTHLAPGGLLALQLFGDRDEWADGGHETEATYHSRAEVDVLTEGLERVFFDEVERDGHTALGDAKHWHIFHMILRRPG